MPQKVTAYHIKDGPVEMYTIHAREAVQNHPGEWSMDPWPEKKEAPPPEARKAEARKDAS